MAYKIMLTCPPEPEKVMQAINLYVQAAYAGIPPARIRAIIEKLETQKLDFYQGSDFERSGDAQRPRYSLRLGNKAYPHMKLVLEPIPEPTAAGYFLRVDSHDAGLAALPTDHPEHAAVAKLCAANKKVTEQIEAAWLNAGLPTFQTYLIEGLENRK